MVEGSSVVEQGLGVRVEGGRDIARHSGRLRGTAMQLGQLLGGKARLVREFGGPAVVLREQCCDRLGVGAAAVLDDARDLVVAARANRPRQGFVGDIADERVLEGELALALEASDRGRDQHVACNELG